MSDNYTTLSNILTLPETTVIGDWVDYLSTSNLSSITSLYPNLNKSAKDSPIDLAGEINGRAQEIGAVIYILEKDSSIKYATNAFYLSGMQFAMKERLQVLEVFESANISFFDESTRVYTFTGVVVEQESQDKNKPYKYLQQSSLIKMYNDVLRGTKLVEREAVAVLKVKNHLIYGYPFQFQSSTNGQIDNMASFSFGWIVTDHKLSYPGIVTDKELSLSYASIENSENGPYLEEVNKILGLIENILIISNWSDGTDTGFDTILKELGVSQINALSYNAIRNINNQSLFINKFQVVINSYKSYVSNFLNKNNPRLLSPLLSQYYTTDLLNYEFDRMINAITKMFKDEEEYINMMTFIKKLIILKNDLLTFRARLVF